MSAVTRIKAELALTSACGKLSGQYTDSRPTATTQPRHMGTITAVRKEMEKLVQILADDASEKHFNVAARIGTCAGYLALISSPHIQEARKLMIEAHRVLQDVMEIPL